MLAMYSGQIGTFSSWDLLLFFIMWELELIPVYLLLSMWGGKKRLYSATKFILYMAGGSIFLLMGVLGVGLYGSNEPTLNFETSVNQSHGFIGAALFFLVGTSYDRIRLVYLDEMVAKATCNFSVCNKIGEGDFGPLYKGALEDGREIAVKRLSETSQQGLDEFKNKVICIASLQHRNLVKLIGYCINQKELILIYEYLSNKSLDFFLFDETRSLMLDWSKRFNIIHGTARGILYLHQDSRLQIIHRDLKVGNILLDSDINPKIFDFGFARNFIGHDTTTNTKKVVGTCGYISPEYVAHGRFSIKSDVFSFGVIVLEIISGIKNREFFHGDRSDNLLGHAWRLHQEGRSIEIMSANLDDSCVVSEVLRCIHVALLCVQHHAEDRPTMLSVVLMLVSEGVLPHPKKPTFFTGESDSEVRSGSSVDEYTITKLYAR
ncbi:putative protein kinase RLK-Pelle-DLSV family [Helianthus debilis subsp. tardiflorus]